MAAKKKTRKKPKKTSTRKSSAKKSAKKKTARRKVSTKSTSRQRKRPGTRPKKRASSRRKKDSSSVADSRQTQVPWDGTDAEGLSNDERADSESVGELVDEGNVFEAGVVSGVERADDSDAPVRTRELPEDDVPEEYLDKD